MRSAVVLFAFSVAICGCNKGDGKHMLEPLARGLDEAWQPVALDMRLELHPEGTDSQVTMLCILRNVSANEIVVDQESLPWNNGDEFSVSAVDAQGKVIQQDPIPVPVEISRISVPHEPVTFAPGDSMEGRIDFGLMHTSKLRRDEDWLLLWSYHSLKDWRSEDHYYRLSGITLLKARSQTPPPASLHTSSNSPVNATSSLSADPDHEIPSAQDLGDASEILVVDNTVMHLLAFPWENRMPSTDPDSRRMHISFRLLSERGAPIPATLYAQSFWIVQDHQIWNTGAIEEPVGESNGSSRDFLVRDGPTWRSLSPIDVVIQLGDDKGAKYLLALRHQRIATVE